MTQDATLTFKIIWFGLRKEIIIYEYERGLLYRDGRFEQLLDPGRYVYSRFDRVNVNRVSTRIMSEIISGQEILTADRVTVRLSLVAVFTINDPVVAINDVESYSEQLYHDLQLAVRDVVAAREIDNLLEARSELSEELLAIVQPQAAEYGLEVKRIGIRDIILPGSVRNVFLREVEADREGRAELVKARHEVAAARARANTARILTENPAVLRLRELDALVELASKQGNIIMLPNLAELLRPQTPSANTNGTRNGPDESS